MIRPLSGTQMTRQETKEVSPVTAIRKAVLALSVSVVALAGTRADAAGIKTYLALGDSLAFGYTDPQHAVPSLGDQGYVKPFADVLAARDGGVRPNVINLGIPGETTGTVFTGGQPAT